MTRNLVLVLGDQLDAGSAAFDGFDADADRVWMAEVAEEVERVPSHKLRIAVFFAAMRHFRHALRERGFDVDYAEMGRQPSRDRGGSFAEVLAGSLRRFRPDRLVLVRPGDHRVLEALRRTAEEHGVPLELREDRHFYLEPAAFSAWADGRKELVLEHFYRKMRRDLGILVDGDGEPEGGRWNYDEDNRESFGRDGPQGLPHVRRFRPDDTTREVIELVERRFADHPGSLEHFDLPVTRREARAFLRDFVAKRLPLFGRYEDAMWTGERFLYHSRLSVPLNLKLLGPRECVEAALEAHASGDAPIQSVEAFVRQLIGWREFIRGVYWHFMPGYVELNALECGDRDVPPAFWDGDTRMRCVAEGMRSVLEHGYAHHIVRLMVLGLFAQLLGVHPRRFHDWHMAMYLDAIDWASLPNTLGMSQYGDGGIVGTKPYCASGAYVSRMSNSCRECPYDPKRATGEDACPMTTLYWDFLARHRERFDGNRRLGFQLQNLDRKPAAELAGIRKRAGFLRERIDAGERI